MRKWPFLFHCLAIVNEDQSYWIDQDLAAKKTTTTTTIMWMKIITNKNDMIDSMECIQKKNENETWKECIFIYL